MTELDAVLEKMMQDPRFRGPLSGANARGQARDDADVMTIELLVEDEVVVDAAFQSAGDPVLEGCASFLLLCARGLSVDWAKCVRARVLCRSLRLPESDPRVELTMGAFQAALADADARQPKRKRPRTGSPGAPRGHRKSRTLPSPTRSELALLLPEETYEDLMRERSEILGVLQNLDACLTIGTVARFFHRDRSDLREALLALTSSVRVALPRLSKADRRLVGLVGLGGLTEAEAAFELGVSQPTVHERLWTVAGRVQKILRGAPIKTPTPNAVLSRGLRCDRVVTSSIGPVSWRLTLI